VAVIPWTDPGGERHLVAYVSWLAGPGVTAAALREHLTRLLPMYMVPSYYVVLDALPLTVSGKIDHARLPPPSPRAKDETAATAEPATGTERVLAEEIFGPLLQADRVGATDDFFDLGGNSLRAAQVLLQIKERFGVTVGIGDFLRSPTVTQVALTVDQLVAEQLGDDELLALIEQLPDADTARLLDEQREQQ